MKKQIKKTMTIRLREVDRNKIERIFKCNLVVFIETCLKTSLENEDLKEAIKKNLEGTTFIKRIKL